MKTINANTAAETIFELFKENSWLNKPEVMTKEDYHAKDEAIMFLQRFSLQDANSFEGISEPAQRIASSFLLDFMGKLMHPDHPLNKKTWLVDDSKPLAEQALLIIGHEIADNHLQPPELH